MVKTMSNKNNKLKKELKERVEIKLRDDGIVEFKIVGTFNAKLAEEIAKKVDEEFEIMEKLPGKIKNLADMSELYVDPKVGWSSSIKLRKIAIRFIKWDKMEKLAILGNPTSAFIKIAISFLFKIAGSKKARYFDNYEEAVNWLK
jgi:hypothetical protein